MHFADCFSDVIMADLLALIIEAPDAFTHKMPLLIKIAPYGPHGIDLHQEPDAVI
jgi:hypothetical protein